MDTSSKSETFILQKRRDGRRRTDLILWRLGGKLRTWSSRRCNSVWAACRLPAALTSAPALHPAAQQQGQSGGALPLVAAKWRRCGSLCRWNVNGPTELGEAAGVFSYCNKNSFWQFLHRQTKCCCHNTSRGNNSVRWRQSRASSLCVAGNENIR